MSVIETILEPTSRAICRIQGASSSLLSPLSSKLLGAPYVPRGHTFPGTRVGLPWSLFAQINFAEISEIPDPDLPSSGIFQLYFEPGSTYGATFDDVPQSGTGYLTVFHPNPDVSLHDPESAALHSPKGDDYELFPGVGPIALSFRRGRQTVLPTDEVALSAMPHIEAAIDAHADPDLARNAWHEFEKGPFHQIGGYAFFTQYDPRDTSVDWVVLLQLDSDDVLGLTWGDVGVSNVSIPREALRARDFSRCFFTWDCY